jgi:hypothetical protein
MPSKNPRKPSTKRPCEKGSPKQSIPLAFFYFVADELGLSTAGLIHFMEDKWGPARFCPGDVVVFHGPQRASHKDRTALDNKEPRYADR